MFKTKVVNKYKSDRYDVYIGPGSPYGNPYVIGMDGNREQVIRKYSEYFYKRIESEPSFRLRVESLRGKTLACFCKPKACHGDVIIDYLSDGGIPDVLTRNRCIHDFL